MATKSYKCLNCGAPIHFKAELNKFKCDYCLSEYLEKELVNKQDEETKGDKENKRTKEIGEIPGNLNSYNCNSCGAEVVTDETTTSTFCYYCHNPVIISSRLVGKFKPNKLIPFSIDKKRATDIFLEWVGNKRFVPKDFTNNSQLEKITGIYLPYWWVNCKADVDYVGEGRNIRIWRSMGYEYTETKKYEIIRRGQIDLNNVEEIAFSKIEKRLLNGIGPYNIEKTIAFSMAYLSGFFAEQYDISKEEAAPMVRDQVDRYSKYLIDETVDGYNHVNKLKNNVDISLKQWNYTLLPAWILTYSYNGKTYVYAVNGQTGKSFGEIPLSGKRLSAACGIVFGLTSAALLLGGRFIW